jgi:hypothetical protein
MIPIHRLAVLAGAGIVLAACSGAPEPADLLLRNGLVYTVNDAQPRAEAVAVRDGLIAFAGSNSEAERYRGPATEVVDLAGKTVVPGFADSHAHLAGIGKRETTLNLEGAANLDEFLARVKERVDRAEPGEWITGRGWIETHWTPPVFPTGTDLDKVSPRNPVWLVRADGHGAVANSLALRIAGITRATRNPEGGEILRDPRTGEVSGMLLDRAQGIIQKFLPPETPEQVRRQLEMGARRSAEMGWTSLTIAGNSFDEVGVIEELYDGGRIKIRIYDAVRGPGADADRLLTDGVAAPAHDGRFTVRALKVFMDGALGSGGAALLEPYSDREGNGLLMWNPADLLPLFERALRGGVQVMTHAIGDRANRLTLDLYQKAFENVPAAERKVAEPRWRIEHAQIIDPVDIPRFAVLKVIPSMQPSHAIGDLFFARSRLGEARLAGAYAWRSLIGAGSIIAGGSDAPVEKGDPIVEFYAAAARKDLHGNSEGHWHPEQAVSRRDALKMLTIWAAYASFEEDKRGSIEPGKWADLTVLSQDIMTAPEHEIPRTECLMTMVGGEIIFGR